MSCGVCVMVCGVCVVSCGVCVVSCGVCVVSCDVCVMSCGVCVVSCLCRVMWCVFSCLAYDNTEIKTTLTKKFSKKYKLRQILDMFKLPGQIQ